MLCSAQGRELDASASRVDYGSTRARNIEFPRAEWQVAATRRCVSAVRMGEEEELSARQLCSGGLLPPRAISVQSSYAAFSVRGLSHATHTQTFTSNRRVKPHKAASARRTALF